MLQNVSVADSSPLSEREVEQSKLRHDVEVVRAYGAAHLDEWTEVYFDNEPTVRLIALFAGARLDDHERALRSLVAYPDQLEIRGAAYSRLQLDEMTRRIQRRPEFAEHKIVSWGSARGRLQVRVRADQARLAATLLDDLGDAVDLVVGRFPFPMPPEPDPAEVRANVANSSVPLLSSDVDVTLAERLEIVAGRTGRGEYVLTNHGAHELVLDTNGAVTARVVDPSSGEVVGGFVGTQTAPLVNYSLDVGERRLVPVLVGTASCTRRLGYAVPPGTWLIEATLSLHGIGERRTPLLPIVVVAAPD